MSALSKSREKSGRSSTSVVGKRSGSSRSGARGHEQSEHIAHFSLEELKALRSRTNFARVDVTTEEELERMDREDPDLAGLESIDWAQAEVVLPSPKSAISIRLDTDVLAFFKQGGAGYQSRINAVLRSYMNAQQKD